MLEQRVAPHMLPYFAERLERQRTFEAQAARYANELQWRYFTGDYSGEDFLRTTELPIAGIPVELSFEEYLKSHIESLKLSYSSNPHLILDLGGGLAETWRRLAVHFADDIEADRVHFVVSNLAMTPGELSEAKGLGSVRNEPNAGGQALVHFVQSPFGEVADKTIILRSGQEIPISGNVSLVQEKLAVNAWSLVPEVQVPAIPLILNRFGTYFVHVDDIAEDIYALCDARPFHPKMREHNIERLAGIRYAHHILEHESGLRKVTHVPSGEKAGTKLAWIGYQMQDAPEINLS